MRGLEAIMRPICDSLRSRGFMAGGTAVGYCWICQPPNYDNVLILNVPKLAEAHANNRLAEYVETEIAIWLLTR